MKRSHVPLTSLHDGKSTRSSLFPLLSLMKHRVIILNHLEAIHNLGVIHCDFEERNILQRGKEFRIVDFDRALDEHLCRAPVGVVHDFNDLGDDLSAPELQKICSILYVQGRNMSFWDDGMVFHPPCALTLSFAPHRFRCCPSRTPLAQCWTAICPRHECTVSQSMVRKVPTRRAARCSLAVLLQIHSIP